MAEMRSTACASGGSRRELQQLQPGAHGRQRSAQLEGQHGEKLVFAPVYGAQPRVACAHVALQAPAFEPPAHARRHLAHQGRFVFAPRKRPRVRDGQVLRLGAQRGWCDEERAHAVLGQRLRIRHAAIGRGVADDQRLTGAQLAGQQRGHRMRAGEAGGAGLPDVGHARAVSVVELDERAHRRAEQRVQPRTDGLHQVLAGPQERDRFVELREQRGVRLLPSPLGGARKDDRPGAIGAETQRMHIEPLPAGRDIFFEAYGVGFAQAPIDVEPPRRVVGQDITLHPPLPIDRGQLAKHPVGLAQPIARRSTTLVAFNLDHSHRFFDGIEQQPIVLARIHGIAHE